MTTGRGGSASPSAAPDHPELAGRKKDFRRAALDRRRAYFDRQGAGAAERVRDGFLAAVEVPGGAVVSGYLPIEDELDLRPLLRALLARGHPCCVPVVQGRGRPLLFRDWTPETPLLPGVFGVAVPTPDAVERVPDLLLVPLLGFDRRGHRMGYGAGFYDRTLAGLRALKRITAVGVAYAGQEVDEVPIGAYDARLDWIVTDREALRFPS